MVDKIVSGPALSIKEQYRQDCRYLVATLSDKDELQQATYALWEKFLADTFLQGGEPEIVYKAQKELSVDLCDIIKGFYTGRLDSEAYRTARLSVFRQYCIRLVGLGLASEVPDDTWITPFSEDGIKEELRLVPAKTTGRTDEDIIISDVPLRDKCQEVISAFHSQFGIGRLKEEPDIFMGLYKTLPGPVAGEETDREGVILAGAGELGR